LTASSAGDVTSDLRRPRGPSPPSSVSTTSPVFSLPADLSSSQSSGTVEEEEDTRERYSFPVPALQLREALEDGLLLPRETHRSNDSDNSESLNYVDQQQDASSNISLVEIQEKVIT
jgi:hypothetical protein